MQTTPSTLRTFLALFALGIAMVGVPLLGAWAIDTSRDQDGYWLRHRPEQVRAWLDADASALGIKASQEAAWLDYAQANLAIAERTAFAPPDGADAVTVARIRAGKAAERARKLAMLAEATARLHVVLSLEQRKVLDQICARSHDPDGRHGWSRGRDGSDGQGQENLWESGQHEKGTLALEAG